MILKTYIKFKSLNGKILRAETCHPKQVAKSMFPNLWVSTYTQIAGVLNEDDIYFVTLSVSHDNVKNIDRFNIKSLRHIDTDTVEKGQLGRLNIYGEIIYTKKYEIVDSDGKDTFVFYKIGVKESLSEKSKPIEVGYYQPTLKFKEGDSASFQVYISCKRKYDENGYIDENDKYEGKSRGYTSLEAIKISKC